MSVNGVAIPSSPMKMQYDKTSGTGIDVVEPYLALHQVLFPSSAVKTCGITMEEIAAGAGYCLYLFDLSVCGSVGARTAERNGHIDVQLHFSKKVAETLNLICLFENYAQLEITSQRNIVTSGL